MNKFSLKILNKLQESSDSVTLCFKQPALRKIKYKAGQYLSLIFRINGRRYIRPYSFSSSPSVDQQLEVTVKRVFGGIVSNYIFDHVKIGDTIEVLEPMGDFYIKQYETISDVYLWGVGSGITPLFSIAKELLYTTNDVKVHLYYGNKNRESTIFFDALQVLKYNFPDRFMITFFYSNQKSVIERNYQIGRISEDFIRTSLTTNKVSNSNLHYICGPENLKKNIKKVLMEIGITPQSVYTEDFSLVKDSKQFEDIRKQNVEIVYMGDRHILAVEKGKSILEAALDVGLEIPYSCLIGNCSTCKGKLKNGKAKMIGLSSIREDLLEKDYLLCCSYPLSEDVMFEI